MPEQIIYGSLVTDIGDAKIAESVNLGKKLDIKYLAAGDGNGEAYIPEKGQTALKNLCWQGEITRYEISQDDDKQIIISGTISSDVGFFTMREIGVLDSEGNLIAITNTGNIDIVPYSAGEILNLAITIYIQFTSEQIGAINIVVHPTEEEVLREEFNSQILELKKLIEEVKDKAGFTPITTEEIDEITGEPLESYFNGESLSSDEIDRLLDDDPSNDPDFSSSDRALSESEILQILGEE